MIYYGQIEPNALCSLIVEQSEAYSRIDRYLANKFPDYSRSFLKKLIETSCVKRNDSIVLKSSTLLLYKDIITIQFPTKRIVEESALTNITTNVSVVAETDHFMIVYKPAHLLVHAPSKMSPAITLTDWVLHNHQTLAKVGVIDRPGIVHRLDKETSGIMIITRTNYAHTVFSELFKKREIHKKYYAIVEGHPEPEGTITYAIGRDPYNRIKMAYFDELSMDKHSMIRNIKVRHATTHYKVITYFQNASLVEVTPTTGRTHQIRVHMLAIGHPIMGDELYGKKSSLIGRQALHAQELSFVFDELPYIFSNNFPEDFQQLINNLEPFADN